jgi:predicted MFS family arabinose efflux permease
VPFVACAFAFVLSLISALVVRVPKPAGAAEPAAAREKSHWLQGVRELWHQRTVRAALIMISLLNVGGPALYLAVIVMLKHDGAGNRAIGFVMSGVALGGLLGAALVKPLHKAMGPGKLLLLVSAFTTALLPPLVVPWGPWWVGAVLGVSMLGIPALRVLIDVLIFRQVPDERRGRTIAAVMTVITIGMPLGTALGGLALQFFGATGTILGLTALYVVTIAVALSDRDLRQAAWPAAQ